MTCRISVIVQWIKTQQLAARTDRRQQSVACMADQDEIGANRRFLERFEQRIGPSPLQIVRGIDDDRALWPHRRAVGKRLLHVADLIDYDRPFQFGIGIGPSRPPLAVLWPVVATSGYRDAIRCSIKWRLTDRRDQPKPLQRAPQSQLYPDREAQLISSHDAAGQTLIPPKTAPNSRHGRSSLTS